MEKSFKHEFIDEVKYFAGGKETIALEIEVFAPTNKVLQETTTIEHEYNRSQMKTLEIMRASFGAEAYDKLISDRPAQDKSKEVKKSTEQESPDSVITTMSTGGADLMKCYFALKNILTLKIAGQPFALLDGSEKMTSNIFDDMTPKDTKAILGKYIQTFLTASQNS